MRFARNMTVTDAYRRLLSETGGKGLSDPEPIACTLGASVAREG